MTDRHEHYQQILDGEWIRPPVDAPFMFECCDCGLVHAIWFSHDTDGAIMFSARRNDAETVRMRSLTGPVLSLTEATRNTLLEYIAHVRSGDAGVDPEFDALMVAQFEGALLLAPHVIAVTEWGVSDDEADTEGDGGIFIAENEAEARAYLSEHRDWPTARLVKRTVHMTQWVEAGDDSAARLRKDWDDHHRIS